MCVCFSDVDNCLCESKFIRNPPFMDVTECIQRIKCVFLYTYALCTYVHTYLYVYVSAYIRNVPSVCVRTNDQNKILHGNSLVPPMPTCHGKEAGYLTIAPPLFFRRIPKSSARRIFFMSLNHNCFKKKGNRPIRLAGIDLRNETESSRRTSFASLLRVVRGR